MNAFENLGLWALHRFDPERAHSLSLTALRLGLVPLPGRLTSARLKTTFAGLDLPNPVGLAAGFDKNATAITPLARAGFGFIEVGAATPKPQAGNAKPRLFRLRAERAAINRFGFNNDGISTIAARLKHRPKDAVIGLNLGANKDSSDRPADYLVVLQSSYRAVDFVTVNISSPNTEKLRDLQGKAALKALLQDITALRDQLKPSLPVFLKIAPDLTKTELKDIAETAMDCKISAIIATNTTVSRAHVSGAFAAEKGGLSGQPLFEPSTKILAHLARLTEGQMPLIGVGGVATASQAYQKIKAGASAIQLYTALVYGGISLVEDIVTGLDALLAKDGFASVGEAVGIEKDSW